MNVYKFNGENWDLHNPKSLEPLTYFLKHYSRNNVNFIITSSFKGVKSQLSNIVMLWFAGEAWENDFSSLEEAHTSFVEKAFHYEERVSDLKRDISHEFSSLRQYMRSISAPYPEMKSYLTDMVYSLGETFSRRIVYAYLKEQRLTPFFMKAKDHIMTDRKHKGASIDLEETRKNVEFTLHKIGPKVQNIVLEGAIGKGPEGKCTSFGDNGADYTAAVVASIVEPKELVFWETTGGIRLNGSVAKRVSYGDIFKTQTIHPKALQLMQDLHIPIRVRPYGKLEEVGTYIAD